MNSNENEVEEEIVFVELNGLIDQEWSHAAGQVCKIVGIDSDEPILQLGRNVFSGEYKDTLGTKVLFESNSKTAADNSHADTPVLDYAMCVNKVLQMQRVFLTEHESNSNQPSDSTSTSAPGAGTECKDASVAASSSLAMDSADVVESSGAQAAESDEVTLPSQTAAVDEMDVSHGETDDLVC